LPKEIKSAFPRNAEKHFCLYEAKSCNKKLPMNTGTKQDITLALISGFIRRLVAMEKIHSPLARLKVILLFNCDKRLLSQEQTFAA